MIRRVLYGPPGTGKTTYLMTLLDKALKKHKAENIAFVSYTRQGTYEGVGRAIEKFGLTKPQTRYFRTIHSLCFSNLGASRALMIQKNHYKLLSEKTGINFTGFYTEDFSSTNDAYLHAIAMRKHNPTFADTITRELNARTYNYIQMQYNSMKDQLGILDFDDLLLNYLDHGTPLDVKVAFIDEGQDLTPLQWKVIKKLFSRAEEIYVAGDDDQAVYEWSGANVYEFMNFSSDSIVLDQSYRLPLKVLEVVTQISKDIKHRKEKIFKPREGEGSINTVRSVDRLKLKGGELILARTNYLLRELSKKLHPLGMPYQYKGKLMTDQIIIKAIKAHLKFEKGQIDINAMKRYTAFFKAMNDGPWQHSIDLPRSIIVYYENMIDKGNIDKEPIKLETYHSCKGSENDHVILLPELSNRVYKAMFKRYDSELRCLYVGMTRTRRDLTIIQPESKHYYPFKYFRSA